MKIMSLFANGMWRGVSSSVAACGLSVFIFNNVAAVEDKERSKLSIPTFQEQASAAGVNHQYTGDWEFFVGGGGAAFDCDGNRLPDVFFAGGSSAAQLYRNTSASGGELRFESIALDLTDSEIMGVVGAYAIHLDNDSHIDLVVLRIGENLLLRGDGDCGFTQANSYFNFDGGQEWTTGFSATWEVGAQYPTLAFGNYIDQSAPGSPWGTCHDNVLVRATTMGGASTRPSYANAIALTPGYCSLSLLFTDWNNSGEPALRITNDRQYYRGGQEQLWRLSPLENPTLYTTDDGWKELNIWGMGIAEADINNDGYPEYALTSMGDNMLQQLDLGTSEKTPQYQDIAFDQGTTAHRPYEGDNSKPSTGWHSEFADFNNDTQLDLFIAKGNVSAMDKFALVDPDNLLLQQPDGGFLEVGDLAKINLPTQGRGALVSDFNIDGQLDLMVINREAPVSVFRNLGAEANEGAKALGNWLAIELQYPAVNQQAINARVEITANGVTQIRTVSVGGGHAAGTNGFIHVGLGDAEGAVVRVRWPDGRWSFDYPVFANRHALLERDSPNATYWYPE